MSPTLTRRDVIAMLGVAASFPMAAVAAEPHGREAARAEAVALGLDPDEVVSYGPPTSMGEADPVDREAPIWMLLDAQTRSRLP